MGQTKPILGRDPFGETPDTQFYWSGTARSTPLAQVEAAIDRGNVAIACAGALGSGRTVFLYRLAERLADAGARFIHPDRVVSCKIREPADHVPRAWQGDSPRAGSKGTAVLLLDDVDQLSRAEMAQLHDWWTPLREKPEKVALVVSCAASAVDPDSGSRRQDLRTIIDAVAALQPLTPVDIEEVIRFRLEVAGWEWEKVFAQPALEKIAFYAKGTPKRLVQICSRVMTLAEEGGGFPAGPELVKEAAHQLFLPSHLREFSKQISLGLVPVPGLLNESALKLSPSSSPASGTAIAGHVASEPRSRLASDHAPAWLEGHDANPLDAVQHHEPMRHDEAAAARHQAKDDSEQNREVRAAGHRIAPVKVKRRRLRGTVGVVAVCGMAVVTGVVGYVLGQVDMKPMEVVWTIPQPEPVAPEAGADASGSLPADNVGTAPSPEGAPAPEAAPAPETTPVPEAAAPTLEAAAPTPEDAPLPPEAAPALETAPLPPEPAPDTAAPPPMVEPTPEVVAEPEPSEALAGAEGQAPPAGASADAAEKGGEPQEAQADALSNDQTPSSLARLSTPDGENGLDDAGPENDATAAGSGRSDVGFAEREEARASVPEVEEPRVRLQRDSVVMRAQGLLAKLDLYRDAIDGLLGERTMAAIRKFQKSVSMAETGKVSETLLAALEARVEAMEARSSSVSSDVSGGQRGQSSGDAAVEAAETLQVIDIMTECRGKEAEWIYIAAINRHVLCGGLSAESPN